MPLLPPSRSEVALSQTKSFWRALTALTLGKLKNEGPTEIIEGLEGRRGCAVVGHTRRNESNDDERRSHAFPGRHWHFPDAGPGKRARAIIVTVRAANV
jgi:hypothetical protein